MDKLLEYISIYGWAILVIAVAIIVFIGILKVCKVFSKIKSSGVKKLIYYGLDVALSFAGSAIYFAIFHKAFTGYVVYSFAQLFVTTTLYAIYENFGIRKLVQYLIGLVASWIKKNPDSKLSKDLKKFGLGAEQIEEIKSAVNGKVAENAQKAEEAKKAQEVAKAETAPVAQAPTATAVQNSQTKF